jgi:signal transduction histidine kinase
VGGIRDRVRELGWLAVGAALGAPAPALLFLAVASVPLSLVGGLGVVVQAGVVWAARRLAEVQRHRVAERVGTRIPAPYVALPTGIAARLRAVFRDPATWRDLAWLPGQFVLGLGGILLPMGLWLEAIECVTAPVVRRLVPVAWSTRTGFDPLAWELAGRFGSWVWVLIPVGLGLSVVAFHAPRYLVAGQARFASVLLAPTRAARLAARVSRLTEIRTAAVDASASELRRIERDLHDGAQARLVAVAMSLGVAADVLDADPAEAKTLLAEARANTGVALTELRDLVRGINPPVLADRGLASAVRSLVLDCVGPVELDLGLDRRLPAPVESAAYFVVAEALTNALRHSGAARIWIRLVDVDTALLITVGDDGCGGADPSGGTGLLGIRRRLAAFDGELRVSSPNGGPTLIDMVLPCVF